jgi:hypothetical protein
MKKEKKTVIEVPDELNKMAVEIACMSWPIPRSVDEVLMRALRSGLAHLLVLTEEDVKYRLKQ